jgi:hypothetical protein
MTTAQAERNAVAFEMSVDAPGWYSGLLVACSCERSQGKATSSRTDQKLGLVAFARASHQDNKIVAAYLDAWESAADDGLVPHADELTPDDALAGLEFAPEVHTAEAWSLLIDTLLADKRAKDRAYDAQRNVHRGVTPPRPTPEQIVEEIRTNPAAEKAATREVVRKEIERDQARTAKKDRITDRRPDGTLSQKEIDDADAEFDQLVIKLRAMKRHAQEALGLTVGMHGFQQKTKREIVVDMVAELHTILTAIQQTAQGQSLDDELASLLGGN